MVKMSVLHLMENGHSFIVWQTVVKLNKVNYNAKGKFLEWIYDFHATCRYLDQRKADVAISIFEQMQFYADFSRAYVEDKGNCLRQK